MKRRQMDKNDALNRIVVFKLKEKHPEIMKKIADEMKNEIEKTSSLINLILGE